MRYLIDTCVLSEARKQNADAGVIHWLTAVDEMSLCVSVLTLGEIQAGVAKLSAGKRRRALQRWLDQDLRTRFEGRVLGLDAEVALQWGLLTAACAQRGRTLKVVDALLGATAIQHNLTVVTRNVADFAALPVRVENPFSD